MGYLTLLNNCSGTENVALGSHAMCCNTTASQNVAVGSLAMNKSTTGALNVAVGYEALKATTTAGCNTAIGMSSMLKNTTGIKNVAVGTYAMCAATDGDYNAIVGYQANRLLTTGCYNATLGYVAAYANTTGEYNTAVGNGALCCNTDGDNNVAIGRVAGAFTDTGSGAVTSPDKSTYIGGCTRASQATPLNETVIGFCACGCGNNSVSIGNCDVGVTYINGDTVCAKQHLCVPNILTACCGRFTSDVCINGDALHFANDTYTAYICAASQLTIEADSDNDTAKMMQFKTSGSERMRIHTNGSVGIGDTSPSSCYYLSVGTCGSCSGQGSITTCGAVCIGGALSKASGCFNIKHPLPALSASKCLSHSFVEAPQADNIYSGVVQLTAGKATVNIDSQHDMTDGTLTALNRCFRTFTTNETNWDPVRGSVSGNTLTVESCVVDSTATISWMVLGERHDPHMLQNPYTDSEGRIRVEYDKPEE